MRSCFTIRRFAHVETGKGFAVSVVLLLLGLVALTPLSARAEGATGDFSIGVGMVYPQGDFASYGDPGPNVCLRARVDVPGVSGLSGWASLNYSGFSTDTISTDVSISGQTFPVDQTTSEDAVSFHVGLQLGSGSRNAFFRPRAGVGVGIYYFSTTRTLNSTTTEGEDAELDSETLDSHACMGWRGVVGADFYFKHGWGISVDLLYDHVFNLHRVKGDYESERTSRYQGFSVGAVFPLGA
jgi:hypothetical protein